MRGKLRFLIILGLLGYCFAFQGARGLWEPDEGRYTAVAMEMLRDGNWLQPSLHPEQPHWTKPPLTYWAIAASIAGLGRNEFAARFPSSLAFFLTTLLVYLLGRLFLAKGPWLAPLVYASFLLPAVASNIITTDGLLTLWETAALCAFAYATWGEKRSAASTWLVLMWAAFGGAFATYSLKPSPFPIVRPIVGAGSFGKYNYGGLINTGLFAKNIAPTSAWIYVNQTERDGYFQNNGALQTQFLFKSLTHIGPGDLTLFFTQNNQRFNYYNGATTAQIAQYGDDYNSYTSNLLNPNGTVNYLYSGFNYNNYLNWLGYAKYEGHLGRVRFSDQLYYYYGNGFGAGATTYSQTVLTPTGAIATVRPSSRQVLLRNSVNLTHRWGNIAKLLVPLGPVDSELGFWFNHNNTLHDSRYLNMSNVYLGSSYYEPVVTDTYEPFLVFNYKPIDALKLTAGVKYLYVSRSFVDDVALARGRPGKFDANFSAVLPSVGANLRILPNWHAYVNYSENSNPPGYNQFYTGTYNANLQPQRAKTYTVGTSWELGPWSSQIQAFRVDFSNYILSTTIQVGSFNQTVLANAGKAINQGISWQNNVVLNDMFSAYANVGILDARLSSADQPFPYAPHHTEAVGFIARYHGFRGTISFHEMGNSYYLLGSRFLPLGNRFYSNMSLRYTFHNAPLSETLGFKQMTAALNLNNLFDRSYIVSYSGSSSNPYQKLNLPFNVYATVDATF